MTGSPQPGQISCELNTCPPTALPHLARVPCCGEKDIRRTLCNDGRMTGEKTAPRGQGDGAVGESAAGVVLWSSAAWTWSGETGASAPVVSYAPSGIIFGDQFQGFLACRDEFCVDAPSLHRANGSSDCLLVWQSLPFF